MQHANPNPVRAAALALAALAWAVIPVPAMNLATLPDNNWTMVKPKFKYLPGLAGQFQPRYWCTLRYDSAAGAILFYEGFGGSTHGQYCIYANALYSYSPRTDSVSMLSLSNYFCNQGDPTALPENAATPTPMDRHTYAQFAYCPKDDRVYLAHGASGSGNHQHDLWSYDLKARKWDYLGAAPGATEGWDCACALNLIYYPPTQELYFFRARANVYAYNPATKAWRTLSVKGASGADIGGHGTFDSKRNRFVFFGNNWTADNSGSQVMTYFDVASGTWTDLNPTGTWPPAKSYSPIEYIPKWDAYVLHGGDNQNDTWVYSPAASAWTRLDSPTKTAMNDVGTYLAYDAADDVLVNLADGNMWLLRYKPTGSLVGTKAGRTGYAAPAAPGTRAAIAFRDAGGAPSALAAGAEVFDLSGHRLRDASAAAPGLCIVRSPAR